MAPSAPHVCPIIQIPLAAWTITSVMIKVNPLTCFLYNKHRAPPFLPPGKLEVITVWLFQKLATGLVVTVDDERQDCIGAAVWTGPIPQRGAIARFYHWLVLAFFGTCINLCYSYYGNDANPVVSTLTNALRAETSGICESRQPTGKRNSWQESRERYMVFAFPGGQTRISRKRDWKKFGQIYHRYRTIPLNPVDNRLIGMENDAS